MCVCGYYNKAHACTFESLVGPRFTGMLGERVLPGKSGYPVAGISGTKTVTFLFWGKFVLPVNRETSQDEVFDRANSIVKKALATVREENEELYDMASSLSGSAIIAALDQIEGQVITEQSLTVIDPIEVEIEEASGDHRCEDRCSSSYIKSQSSLHRIPSGQTLDEEEEEEEEEKYETREEYVVKKIFLNYTHYANSLNESGHLTEKRFLQMLRELDLIGYNNLNTTDAEILYFKLTSDR
eukprot:sb/3469074/